MLLDWILPDNMWDDFYLDPWVYVKARYRNNEIVGWQVVHINFWNKIKDIYGKEEEIDSTTRVR